MLSHAKLHRGTDEVRPQVSHEQPENRVADNVVDGVLCVLELLEGVRCVLEGLQCVAEGVRCVLEAVENCALYAVGTAGDTLCAEGGRGCAEGGGGCAEGDGGCAKVVEVVVEVVRM